MAPVDRRGFVTGLTAGAMAGSVRAAGTRAPDPTEWWDLWPGIAPGAPAHGLDEVITERSSDPVWPDRAIHGISRPRMALFRPARPNGAAVIITPGGGYRWVVVDKEGFEFARWLAERGFTAFVLFYRLPGEGWASGPDTPLIDAQRAIRLVRHRAAALSLDPARIATVGFSAGGHVCADLAARFDKYAYVPVDPADALSTRPFCAAPIYPVVSMDAAIAHAGSRAQLIGGQPSAALEARHSPDRNIRVGAPPHFLVHAEDDPAVLVENSLRLRSALKAVGAGVETHLFAEGGHGFGLRRAAGKPVAAWPDLWAAWAYKQGLVPG